MKTPECSTDPCWYWKEYELERTAARMRNGDYGIPQPTLTDSQKVQIAYLLLAKHKPSDYFAVWIDEGRLRVRYGLQGQPVPLTWLHAIRLVDYFKRPVFRKTLAVAGIERRAARNRREGRYELLALDRTRDRNLRTTDLGSAGLQRYIETA